MQNIYLLAMLYFLNTIFFVVFFIFITAVAVYLKIFIQKKLDYREFIVSKYTGGISGRQIKSFRSFYILYDFLMLLLLSLMTYLIPAVMMFKSEDPYKIVGSFLFLLLLLVIVIPLDKLVAITRLKWVGNCSSPQGMIMVWEPGGAFGDSYNFLIKFFWKILLLAIVISCVLAVIFITIIKI